MDNYYYQVRYKTGGLISTCQNGIYFSVFDDIQDAENFIKELENIDKAHGTYEDDFYHVVKIKTEALA
jgi:hypothetical protein